MNATLEIQTEKHPNSMKDSPETNKKSGADSIVEASDFSVYYGRWREAPFYVTQGSVDIGTLKEGEEKYKSLSFNIIGVNPL